MQPSSPRILLVGLQCIDRLEAPLIRPCCMVLCGICVVLYGILWYCMVLHSIVWRYVILYGILWYCMVLHSIVWYCIVLYGTMWYCMVLHGIARKGAMHRSAWSPVNQPLFLKPIYFHSKDSCKDFSSWDWTGLSQNHYIRICIRASKIFKLQFCVRLPFEKKCFIFRISWSRSRYL